MSISVSLSPSISDRQDWQRIKEDLACAILMSAVGDKTDRLLEKYATRANDIAGLLYNCVGVSRVVAETFVEQFDDIADYLDKIGARPDKTFMGDDISCINNILIVCLDRCSSEFEKDYSSAYDNEDNLRLVKKIFLLPELNELWHRGQGTLINFLNTAANCSQTALDFLEFAKLTRFEKSDDIIFSHDKFAIYQSIINAIFGQDRQEAAQFLIDNSDDIFHNLGFVNGMGEHLMSKTMNVPLVKKVNNPASEIKRTAETRSSMALFSILRSFSDLRYHVIPAGKSIAFDLISRALAVTKGDIPNSSELEKIGLKGMQAVLSPAVDQYKKELEGS